MEVLVCWDKKEGVRETYCENQTTPEKNSFQNFRGPNFQGAM